MSVSSIVETDTRVLKEDYCNFDLIARCWNDEYRGRVWKNKERIADCEGTDLDEIMRELRGRTAIEHQALFAELGVMAGAQVYPVSFRPVDGTG